MSNWFATQTARIAVWAGAGSLLLLSGCVLPPQGPELGRFTLAQGGTAIVRQVGPGPAYRVFFPEAAASAGLGLLTGLLDVHVTDRAALGTETTVLLEGVQPGCGVRTMLLAVGLPQTRSIAIPGCGRHFTFVTGRDGRSMILRQIDAKPATYFVYQYGNLSGPAVEQVQRAAIRRRAAAPAPADASRDRSASPPVDLDAMPTPAGTTPLDLDK